MSKDHSGSRGHPSSKFLHLFRVSVRKIPNPDFRKIPKSKISISEIWSSPGGLPHYTLIITYLKSTREARGGCPSKFSWWWQEQFLLISKRLKTEKIKIPESGIAESCCRSRHTGFYNSLGQSGVVVNVVGRSMEAYLRFLKSAG